MLILDLKGGAQERRPCDLRVTFELDCFGAVSCVLSGTHAFAAIFGMDQTIQLVQ